MPELPEVETIRRVLAPQIKGQKIMGIGIAHKQVIAHPSAELFCDRIIGQAFSHVERRGKFLIFCFAGGDSMVVHLRMTGSLLVTPPEYPQEKHTHVVFSLADGKELRYIDARRFGRLWLLEKGEEDNVTGMDKLGPEPFDEALTAEYLRERLLKRKKSIKECLLDQSIVAGIGNIYGDEILFAAGIHPARPARDLTMCEYERLVKQIYETLEYFIEKNVIPAEDYLAGKGQTYRNTPYLRVYGKEKKPCPICGRELQKIVLAGRSSVFCAHCQDK